MAKLARGGVEAQIEADVELSKLPFRMFAILNKDEGLRLHNKQVGVGNPALPVPVTN